MVAAVSFLLRRQFYEHLWIQVTSPSSLILEATSCPSFRGSFGDGCYGLIQPVRRPETDSFPAVRDFFGSSSLSARSDFPLCYSLTCVFHTSTEIFSSYFPPPPDIRGSPSFLFLPVESCFRLSFFHFLVFDFSSASSTPVVSLEGS